MRKTKYDWFDDINLSLCGRYKSESAALYAFSQITLSWPLALVLSRTVSREIIAIYNSWMHIRAHLDYIESIVHSDNSPCMTENHSVFHDHSWKHSPTRTIWKSPKAAGFAVNVLGLLLSFPIDACSLYLYHITFMWTCGQLVVFNRWTMCGVFACALIWLHCLLCKTHRTRRDTTHDTRRDTKRNDDEMNIMIYHLDMYVYVCLCVCVWKLVVRNANMTHSRVPRHSYVTSEVGALQTHTHSHICVFLLAHARCVAHIRRCATRAVLENCA